MNCRLHTTTKLFALLCMCTSTQFITTPASSNTSCFAKSFYQDNANCKTTKSMRSIYSNTLNSKSHRTTAVKRFDKTTIKILEQKRFPHLKLISGGPLTHAITIQSSLKSASAARKAPLPASAALHIRCIENRTSVLFDFPSNMKDANGNTRATAEILYSLDKGKDKLLGLSISNESNILGLWNGISAVPFTKSLFGKKQLKVNAWNIDGVESIYKFNITNLHSAITNLRTACNW